MPADNKIVVEALIPAPVELVWERTQEPAQHVAWDIRFTHISYREEVDARGFRVLDYRTDVAFGIAVAGIGRYLHSTPLEHSTFEFDSDDWKSIIRNGRGVWIYESRPEGTFFKTVYDYDWRYGVLGRGDRRAPLPAAPAAFDRVGLRDPPAVVRGKSARRSRHGEAARVFSSST